MNHPVNSPAPAVRIVLCVTAETANGSLARCLEAALPLVDGYVVGVPTGDECAELVARRAAARGIVGRVLAGDWSDAGAGTRCAAAARAWAEQRGFVLEHTYLLLLAPSMVVHVEADFDRDALSAAAYEVRHDDGDWSYYGLRLACSSREWIDPAASGALWEPVGDDFNPQRLETIWIEETGRASRPRVDLERRAHRLRSLCRDQPANPRYALELAELLHDLGLWEEAGASYARLREIGGSTEELWYAHYREAMCRLRGGDALGASLLLAVFERCPTRAEPLHALARYYRERGCMQLAFTLARRGLEVVRPIGAARAYRTVHDWGFWEEVMISGFYSGPDACALGFSACERLLARRDSRPEFQEYVAGNESFYVAPLSGVRRGTIGVSELNRNHEGTEYVCTNPSVVRLNDRTIANVRLVNYRQDRGLSYVSTAGDGVIRTRNVTLEAGSELGEWCAERVSHFRLPADWREEVVVRGLEDMRWVVHRDRVWFTATCCHLPDSDGMPQMVLGRMNEALDAVEHLVAVRYDGALRVEKNWVPWSRDGTLYLVYSYDPFVVLHVDPHSGSASAAFTSEPAFSAKRFRGATSPVPIPGSDHWLALIHEVAHLPSGRIYTHRFVELGRRFELLARSRPFCFDHRGIEYAAGLCAHGGDRLLVTYGWEDREARWIELEWSEALRRLRES